MKLTVAFGITGAGGLALDKLKFELPGTVGPVAVATLLGGVLIILVERWRWRSKPTIESVTWGIAVACGVAQLVAAVFPGTSRSGITIMVAIAMGLVRHEAAEFSFILGRTERSTEPAPST
jgi:undecaprenyl-diphosphatase